MKLNILTTVVISLACTLPIGNANAEDLFTVDGNNVVTVVDTNDPTLTPTSSGTISGLAATETILGLDYRANGGGIYAIGSSSNVYTIDQTTFAATQVGTAPLNPTLVGSTFAYDFNPAASGGILSRIISGDTQNNRVIDSTTGGYFGTADKTPVFYAAGDANDGATPSIQGIAYDNNVLGSTATQQFGIDSDLGILTTVANNAGTLETVGTLGLAGGVLLTDELAFDISGDTGDAFAALQLVGGPSQLYSIDLDTGAATLEGAFSSTVRDFTIVPSAIPEPSSLSLLGLGAMAFVSRRRKTS